jgi:hypothetical protein
MTSFVSRHCEERLVVVLALKEIKLLLLVVVGEGRLVAGGLTLASSGTVDSGV